MRVASVVLMLAITAGCESRPQAGAKATGLTVFNSGTRVQYDGRVLSVVAASDVPGGDDRVLLTKPLSPAECAFLDERIEKVPLASLKDEYRNPDVWDGLQISFEIRQKGKPVRS